MLRTCFPVVLLGGGLVLQCVALTVFSASRVVSRHIPSSQCLFRQCFFLSHIDFDVTDVYCFNRRVSRSLS